ncbi:hypothetical protein GF362_06220 [Candidatus Dojkabacteria bacterium]|nr:hypothetical protein [Candidatus Dojkabacteria bacterium]
METQDYFGIGSIVLGVINLCSWFLPLCGCPLSIVGIILGVLGMKSKKYKTMAIIGLVLSIIGILLTIGNGLLGVYWAENPPDFMNSY